jgi:vacuolar-type H+-ATPase subunit C/Vma6
MSGYDYGNARLRAMKSRLLSGRDLEALAEIGSLDGLIAALAKTVYRETVEIALVRASGLACVNEALRLT